MRQRSWLGGAATSPNLDRRWSTLMTDADTTRAAVSQKDAAAFDFDTVHDRSHFGSVKWANQWDEFSPRVEGDNLLSLWTADMDFRAPETVIARLREAVEHGVYGYT